MRGITRKLFDTSVAAIILCGLFFSSLTHAKTYTSELYDTVIIGGRVMDPETLTDRVPMSAFVKVKLHG